MEGQGRQLLPKVAKFAKVANFLRMLQVAKTAHTQVGDLGDLRQKPRILARELPAQFVRPRRWHLPHGGHREFQEVGRELAAPGHPTDRRMAAQAASGVPAVRGSAPTSMYAFAFGSVPLGRRQTFAVSPLAAAGRSGSCARPGRSSPLNGPMPAVLVPQVLEAASPPARRSACGGVVRSASSIRRHVLLALDAGHDDVQHLVAEVAELAVQVVEVVDDRPALPLLVEGQLPPAAAPRRRRPCRGCCGVTRMPWLSSVAITKSSGVPRTSLVWPVASSCQSTSAMYLKPTSRLSTTCAPKCRAMRRDLARRHLRRHDDRRRAAAARARAACCSLKCVSRAAISLPVMKR